MQDKVSVVIPVFGRDDVFRTVDLLRGVDYVESLRVIVVDNGNEEPLSQRLAGLESEFVHVIRLDENRGGSGGYIAGVKYAMEKHADSNLIWLLDDDAVPNAESLPGLCAVYHAKVAEGIPVASVGSVEVSLTDGETILECGADFSYKTNIKCKLPGERLSEHPNETLEVTYTSGASGLLDKNVIRACGFWGDVFIHYDDVEWGVRTTRLGYKNFATTRSVVRHPVVGGIGHIRPWISYYDTYNYLWLGARHYKLAFVRSLLKSFAYDCWHLLIRGVPERDVAALLARFDFLKGRRRLRKEVEEVMDELKACLCRHNRLRK